MLSMSHCIPDPITVAARFDGIAIMTYTVTTHMSNHYNKPRNMRQSRPRDGEGYGNEITDVIFEL